MMPEPPYTVIQQEERARWNNDSTITKQIHIRFMVGKFGPFSEDFDLDTFTPSVRDARLRDRARAIWID